MRSHMLILSLTAALGLNSVGCIKKVLLDGQIESTRQGATAAETVGDYDLGRTAAAAGIAQFEGMHALGPDNTDALFLLAKTWTVFGNAFIEDDMQAAQDAGNEELAAYAQKRARMAYDRAVFYGLQLLGQKDDSFPKVKKSGPALEKWLKDNFSSRDDAINLVWAGSAWLARGALMAGDDDEGPQFVSELYVAAAFLERAAAIDPSVEHYQAPLLLAGYHARSNLAELDQAKAIFDDLIQKTKGKTLLVQLNYGIRYACVKGDAALYQRMLEEVLQAKDLDPDVRAANAVAKRLAKRWLGRHRAKDQCGIDLPGGPPASSPETPVAPVTAPAPAPSAAAPAEPAPEPEAAKPEAKPEAKPDKPRRKAAKPAAPK
jgi:tetratricopeptide (TPR) repeat protein